MRHKKKKKIRFIRFMFPAFCMLVFLYIINQVLYGERGVFVWHNLTTQVRDLNQQNRALEEHAASYRIQAKRLNPNTPDEDYMNELVRKNLSVAKENEVIIYMPSDEIVQE